MIARIVIPLVIIVVLSDLYIDAHYFRRHRLLPLWGRLLWWLPCAVIVAFTCVLASLDSFTPKDQRWLEAYLLLLGLLTGPKAIFALCSSVGWMVRKSLVRTRRNYGHYLGLVLGAVAVAAYAYGLTGGFSQVRVRHVSLSFPDLPPSFDGYRIAHLSDLHLGTFRGWRHKTLEAEVDSILRQHADLIVFTGDMQNMHPEEMERELPLLQRLSPMLLVLGNHDYGQYAGNAKESDARLLKRLKKDEARLGQTLTNSCTFVENPHSHERLWIVGEENYGKPMRADWRKATRGVPDSSFVIYLQHNPQAWRDYILPRVRPQLTLSGHTHGGQMQLFGLRPTMLSGHEDCGLYEEQGRYLYVSAGLGGLVPFRLGLPNEVVLITLHRTPAPQHHPH